MMILADSKIPDALNAFSVFGDVTVVKTPDMTREAVRNADAILVRSETPVNARLLDGSRVRFVGTATIGMDHVDLEYLQSRNITFASCPGSNANSVAEYVLAALLEISLQLNTSLRGATLGVVGHGNTGSRVARKAEAIGMRVLLNDPPIARATGSDRYLPLDELMDADYISLHVPLTKSGEDATYHLFDTNRLKNYRGVLINSSRGAVVETAALSDVLSVHSLKGAILDVWEKEPGINVDLLRRVALGTPHIAGYSFDGKLNATRMLQSALATFSGITVAPDPISTNHISQLILQRTEDDEALLRRAVRQAYDIRSDDQRLRALLALDAAERPAYFRQLRAQYGVRREFANHCFRAEDISIHQAPLLRSVGFRESQEKS